MQGRSHWIGGYGAPTAANLRASSRASSDAAGPVGGSRYHSVHRLGDLTSLVDVRAPPFLFERDEIAFGIPVHSTMQIIPTDGGSILRIKESPPAEGDPAMHQMLTRGAARDAFRRLAELLPS